MTNIFPALCCSALLLAAVGGCDSATGDAVEPEYVGPEVEIAVAALDLPNVSDADYRVTVRNDDGVEVWQREISSTAFGDGEGSVSYVGPCDASSNPNSVELEVVDLYKLGAVMDTSEYVNPAPVGAPLALTFQCEENRDVFVEFNLTILRNADQGFFDIAVNFNDVFCSAKFDCEDDDGNEIELLPNPYEAYARQTTTILAFACTGDPVAVADGETNTALYLDDIVITCDDQTWRIDPSGGPGNLDADSISPDPADGTYIYGAAVYRGEEAIANKLFWNLAIGLETEAFADAGDCVLTTRATAADEDLGHVTPAMTTYPYIEWNVTLSGIGGLACDQHALDGFDEMVQTRYTGIDTTVAFDHEFQYLDVGKITTAPGAPDSRKVTFEDEVGGADAADIWRMNTQGGATVVWHDVVFERRGGSTAVRLEIFKTEPGEDAVPIATLEAGESTLEIPAATIAPQIEHPLDLYVVAESTAAAGSYRFDAWLCTDAGGCVSGN